MSYLQITLTRYPKGYPLFPSITPSEGDLQLDSEADNGCVFFQAGKVKREADDFVDNDGNCLYETWAVVQFYDIVEQHVDSPGHRSIWLQEYIQESGFEDLINAMEDLVKEAQQVIANDVVKSQKFQDNSIDVHLITCWNPIVSRDYWSGVKELDQVEYVGLARIQEIL